MELVIHAQNPGLEFSQNSRGTGNGPTLNSGAFTFLKNTNDPTGNTYATYTPALTATFTIDNPQVTSGTGISAVTNSPMNFGYAGNNSSAITSRMSLTGTPVNTYFTSSGATTAGTGIAAASTTSLAQANFAVSVGHSVSYLNGQPVNGTYHQADIIITFNRPVSNPILHLTGMGGIVGAIGFSALYELDNFTASSSSLVLSKLSGTSALDVTGNTISNIAATISTNGDNAASGSVLVSGEGITSIKFNVSVRGQGTVKYSPKTRLRN